MMHQTRFAVASHTDINKETEIWNVFVNFYNI